MSTGTTGFSINPCKGCWDTYNKEYCDINTINSCVTETAAAFSGIPSNNFIRGTDADANWKECMVKMMAAQGRDPCDFQLSMAPVWAQSPHYFPNLLYTTQDPDKAYTQCVKLCNDDKYHRGECVRNCGTDRASVVPDNKQGYRRNIENFQITNTNTHTIFLVIFICFLLAVLGFLLYFNK